MTTMLKLLVYLAPIQEAKFYEGATLFDFVDLANYLKEKLNLKVDLVSERAVRK